MSLAVRLAFAIGVDVFQDEGLYWWGAQGGGLSFCPHPPATSWMVGLGTAVFGQGLLGLRAASLACGTGAILVAYLLGRELYGCRAGLWSAALLASCPLFAGTGAAATPDSLLVLLWLLFAWAVWRGATRGGRGWWLGCGLLLAAGLYTKYMMVLALPAAFLALCMSPEGRRALRTPWPWVAAALGLGLFLPAFLGWNWLHGWASVRYHLGSRHAWSSPLRQGAHYLVTHAGALSLLLYVAVLGAFVGAARAWRRGDSRGAWVLAFGALPILFFLAPSVLTEHPLMRVQWDAIGYAVGVIALGGIVGRAVSGEADRPWRRWLAFGSLTLACASTGVLLLGSFWPGIPAALGVRPPTLGRLGWRELAERVEQASTANPADFIATDSFGTAFALGFHRGRPEPIYTLQHPRNTRYGLDEQLRTWRMDESHLVHEYRGRDGLYVEVHDCFDRCRCGAKSARAQQLFKEMSLIDTVSIFQGGRMVRCLQIYRSTALEPKPVPKGEKG